MNRFTLILPMALVLPLAGCDKKEDSSSAKPRVSGEDVKREVGEAARTVKEYVGQEKDEYLKKVQADLEQLDKKIDELKAKAVKAGKEAKAEFDKDVAELQIKKEAARKKLVEIKAASGEAWKDVKTGADAALEDLKKAYDKAVSRFN